MSGAAEASGSNGERLTQHNAFQERCNFRRRPEERSARGQQQRQRQRQHSPSHMHPEATRASSTVQLHPSIASNTGMYLNQQKKKKMHSKHLAKSCKGRKMKLLVKNESKL